uniref:Uncharacterized protein n=1 Tax=Romanomermis culicivorax TaxID=13658 RepID=A0A915HKQ6_ROMCU
MAKEEGVPRELLRRLVKLDIRSRSYHKRKVAGLSNKQVEKSDEKLFLMEESYNFKNDVVYSARFDDISREELAVKHYQNKSSMMVCGAV